MYSLTLRLLLSLVISLSMLVMERLQVCLPKLASQDWFFWSKQKSLSILYDVFLASKGVTWLSSSLAIFLTFLLSLSINRHDYLSHLLLLWLYFIRIIIYISQIISIHHTNHILVSLMFKFGDAEQWSVWRASTWLDRWLGDDDGVVNYKNKNGFLTLFTLPRKQNLYTTTLKM